MAYEPTNWKSGDIVTSAKLNKLENGVKDAGPLIIGFSEANPNKQTLDHTWQEIYDAMTNKRQVVVVDIAPEPSIDVICEAVAGARKDQDTYVCFIADRSFATTSANGYPSYGE